MKVLSTIAVIMTAFAIVQAQPNSNNGNNGKGQACMAPFKACRDSAKDLKDALKDAIQDAKKTNETRKGDFCNPMFAAIKARIACSKSFVQCVRGLNDSSLNPPQDHCDLVSNSTNADITIPEDFPYLPSFARGLNCKRKCNEVAENQSSVVELSEEEDEVIGNAQDDDKKCKDKLETCKGSSKEFREKVKDVIESIKNKKKASTADVCNPLFEAIFERRKCASGRNASVCADIKEVVVELTDACESESGDTEVRIPDRPGIPNFIRGLKCKRTCEEVANSSSLIQLSSLEAEDISNSAQASASLSMLVMMIISMIISNIF